MASGKCQLVNLVFIWCVFVLEAHRESVKNYGITRMVQCHLGDQGGVYARATVVCPVAGSNTKDE